MTDLATYPLSDIVSPFAVLPLTSDSPVYEDECAINSETQETLVSAGWKKLACVFGVVIAGTDSMPDDTMLYAANVAANFLDPGNTGSPTNEDAHNAFKTQQSQSILGGGTSMSDERDICDEMTDGIVCYSFQAWNFNDEREEMGQEEWDANVKRVINEEIFHMYTHALANAFPEQIGDTDFTSSVSCREMARLQCLSPGWHHPENTCPNGNPDDSGEAPDSPLEGTCNDASCDCVEFFNQAVLGLLDQEPAWRSDNMPEDQQGFDDMLSEEFKEMVSNEAYGLPQDVFAGIYTGTPAEDCGCSLKSDDDGGDDQEEGDKFTKCTEAFENQDTEAFASLGCEETVADQFESCQQAFSAGDTETFASLGCQAFQGPQREGEEEPEETDFTRCHEAFTNNDTEAFASLGCEELVENQFTECQEAFEASNTERFAELGCHAFQGPQSAFVKCQEAFKNQDTDVFEELGCEETVGNQFTKCQETFAAQDYELFAYLGCQAFQGPLSESGEEGEEGEGEAEGDFGQCLDAFKNQDTDAFAELGCEELVGDQFAKCQEAYVAGDQQEFASLGCEAFQGPLSETKTEEEIEQELGVNRMNICEDIFRADDWYRFKDFGCPELVERYDESREGEVALVLECMQTYGSTTLNEDRREYRMDELQCWQFTYAFINNAKMFLASSIVSFSMVIAYYM